MEQPVQLILVWLLFCLFAETFMVEDWSDPVFCVYDGFRLVYLEPNMFC